MKKLTFLIAAIAISSTALGVHAQDSTMHDDLRALKDLNTDRVDDTGTDLISGISGEDIHQRALGYKEEVSRAMESVRARNKMGQNEALEKYESVGTIYFVSLSMGEESIKEVFRDAATDKEKRLVVIRGIPEGEKIPDGLQPYFQMVNEVQPSPQFVLDPSLFKKFSIRKVPAIVKLRKDKDILSQNGLARVYGLHSSNYLNEQIEKGETGNIGTRGNVVDILEPNLIEVMKQKLANVDWEQKKRQAASGYWKKQEFHSLEAATEDRTRWIDPSITVTADLKSGDGEVVVPQGTTINPLEKYPFNRTMFVFNPLRKAEVDFVKRQLEGMTVSDGIPVLMASEFNREAGWDGYKSLTDDLNTHVYKLVPDVKSRWHIEKTPTVITAEGNYFKVVEHRVMEEAR
ncbi:TrbC family F-type conjugative pilus assembly protein [Halomonas sp. I5-271120]|uniref:TrbC family F-type conjugative pilus assembly protein n=1 Tax=Halomonas sp. I5-271120 TaxID=3061632 RepID=UPI002714D252|nr:TrbC family F-type conjugative pilus assembly protein [Halomonas sp. I5-271120]